MSVTCGIDPGKDGAIAILHPDGKVIVFDMPEQESGLRDLFDGAGPAVHVFLEKQQAMPKQGVSSTFTTGEGYGFLKGMLSGLGIPYEVVTPQRWMRGMGIPSGADKAQHIRVAKALFPDAKFEGPRGGPKDGRADASLIALWGSRQRKGE